MPVCPAKCPLCPLCFAGTQHIHEELMSVCGKNLHICLHHWTVRQSGRGQVECSPSLYSLRYWLHVYRGCANTTTWRNRHLETCLMPVSLGPLIHLQTSVSSIHLPLTERAPSSCLFYPNTCLPLAPFIAIGPSGLSRAMKRNVPEDIEDKNKPEKDD